MKYVIRPDTSVVAIDGPAQVGLRSDEAFFAPSFHHTWSRESIQTWWYFPPATKEMRVSRFLLAQDELRYRGLLGEVE